MRNYMEDMPRAPSCPVSGRAGKPPVGIWQNQQKTTGKSVEFVNNSVRFDLLKR